MESKKTIITTITLLLAIGITAFAVFGGSLLRDKLTYVSSTEYIAGDEGQTIIKLTDFRGTPIIATCLDTIIYPDKTIFQVAQAMIGDGYGNYFHNFTVPANRPGVYTTNVNCTFGARTAHASKTFHISLLNTAIQNKLDQLNITLTEGNLKILNQINTTQNNLSQTIIDTQNQLQDTQNNISNQISVLSLNVKNNFSSVISLIKAINNSQNHEEIMNFLQLINQTTQNTNTNLNNFQTQTNNNFVSINKTVNGIKNDTQLIIQLINNVSITFNQSTNNLTQEINQLVTLNEENHNVTQTNLTKIIKILLGMNQTINTGFNDINHSFILINNTVTERFDILDNITNWTHMNTELILVFLNISLDSINIHPSTNDCWIGGQWVAFAKVMDNFGNKLDDNSVSCEITTSTWGLSNMTYNAPTQKFKYTHTCDIPGIDIIDWSIQCLKN